MRGGPWPTPPPPPKSATDCIGNNQSMILPTAALDRGGRAAVNCFHPAGPLSSDVILMVSQGRFVTKSTFNLFSLCTFAVFCLGRMTFCKPLSYTQSKISVTYQVFTAELIHGLACYDSIYIVLIFLLKLYDSE